MPPLKKRKLSHDGESSEDASQQSSNAPPGHSDVEDNADTIDETPTKTVTTFKELGIVDSLCEACESLGYKTPTPIQAQSIPLALQGRDLIGLAETGSGKTAAFVLPILQDLLNKVQQLHSLILAPTRELAYQISHVVEALGSLIGVRCVVLVGGMPSIPQAIALGKKPHIVVATPGRLIDHLENTKGFSLRQLKYLVMDEADRLLDLDFGPILLKILKHLPKPGRKTYLFSATMSRKVEDLQRASLSSPVRVSVSQDKYQTVSTLIQSYLLVPHKHKDLYLVHILNELAGQTAIIFTRTVNEAQRVSILLGTLGFSAIPIHGGLSQPARLAALNKFRAKSRELLVATDVAARGLDIPSVDLVVNFDPPDDSKTYIHRVGRTARAGKSGKAISFFTQYDVEFLMHLEKALKKDLNEYETVKEEVMVLAERVGDARRAAVMKMKELHEDRDSRKKGSTLRDNRGGKGAKGKRRRDDMDQDEG